MEVTTEASADIEAVLSHLNSKTSRNFRAASSHGSLILTRLETHSVDDMKAVIDNKCNEWMGTDGQKYLRPDTLFRKSNFSRYLEEIDPTINENLTPKQIEHREYLASAVWQTKRLHVISRARCLCEGCGVNLGDKGHVHHTTYDHWKDEFLFELLYLCQSCHKRIHKI